MNEGITTALEKSDITTTLDNSRSALVDSFQRAYDQIVQFGPRVLAMLVVLVTGYVVARLVAQAVSKLSEKIGLQTATERSGLADSMRNMGIHRNVPAILGAIVFWLLMCVFIMTGFNILGLTGISNAMDTLVKYIPNLLIATVIVVVGLLVASFLRGVIATSADRIGISYAEHLANGCYYVLALLTLIAAFNKLGVEFDLLDKLILIAAGGLAVGFGLAFGLGGRDVMAGILAGYYLRQRLSAGDHVEVAGLEGTVREVGPVATIIETEEDGMVDRRTVPNTKMLNEAVR